LINIKDGYYASLVALHTNAKTAWAPRTRKVGATKSFFFFRGSKYSLVDE
jgi:hypothetical protein